MKTEFRDNVGLTSHLAEACNVTPLRRPKLFFSQANKPLTIVRNLIAFAKSYGCNSVSYHLAVGGSSSRNTAARFFFASRKSFPISKQSVQQARSVGSCYDFILREGKPVAVQSMMPAFLERAPKVTEEIANIVRQKGFIDEYMVPVFAAFNTRAVISFGFPVPTSDIDPAKLDDLTIAATIAHTQLVSCFGRSNTDAKLSERERAVLNWVAKGKSNNDIATILHIQPSSVDTYTRRIFKKLGVNDRISAAMDAVRQGLLDY